MKTFTDHMQELIARRDAAEDRDPIWEYASKLGARALGRALRLNVPELWAMFGPDWCQSPPWSGCVIKPTSASNSRGVLPLAREGQDQWKSMLGDGRKSWRGWWLWSLKEQERHEAEGVEPYRQQWLVEDLILRATSHDPDRYLLPYDWKCYAIGGRVAWVNQIDKPSSRNARTYRTRHWWRTLEGLVPASRRVIDQPRQMGALPPPRWPDALLEVADRVASYLREETGTPFVRVDLYEHDDGRIFLGEITPHPSGGKEIYDEKADHILGSLWSHLEEPS